MRAAAMRAAAKRLMREDGAQDTDAARRAAQQQWAPGHPPALVTLSSLHRSRQLSSGRTTTRLAVPVLQRALWANVRVRL